jgi:ATP-binding cassette, subfamily B, multidrug efflux pump
VITKQQIKTNCEDYVHIFESTMKSLFYLNKYLVKYKYYIILGLAFIICSNFFGVYMPKIIDQAADNLTKFAENQNIIDSDFKSEIWSLGLSLALTFMGFAILKGIFLFFTRQTIIVMSRLIEFDLKNEIFAKYQSLNISFYKENKTGDLMNRISEDVSKVRMYLGPAIMYTLNVIVLFIMVVSFMLYKNVELTIYVLLPLPILSLIIYKVSSTINKKSEITQKQQSKISSYVQEAFSGIRVLKAYNRFDHFKDQYAEETENYKRASLSLAFVNAMFLPAIILLIGISTITTIYVGGIKTINNELDYGDILQFIFYINMLTWPFASVGWVSSLIQRAAASQKRINEFLVLNDKIIDNGEENVTQINSITFKKVNFKYNLNEPKKTLSDINFHLDAGQSLGIIGKTGSGKSTIAQLISRLYDFQEGEILLNNTPIKEFKLSEYRKKIGYIPQDVFLFSDTVMNNIAFGLHENEFSKEQIETVAKKSGIFEEINKLPKKFDTKIGERGVTLSGGQKQRVSIARALIRNPELILFDDCLSAVDTETSNKILNTIQAKNSKQISIHISHRVNAVIHCDHILVLIDGEIVEEGNHNFLISRNGFYQRTYKKQQLEDY